MKKIIILTGAELRHSYFRKFLALDSKIEVLNTYCEGLEKSIHTIVEQDDNNDLRSKHLAARTQSEIDFFAPFVENIEDDSNPIFLPKGDINKPEIAQKIIDAKPDLIIAYGCSLIKEPLLSAFEGKFLNVHLGLSPYYRGAGTNYWPLVNAELEFVGATFMYIDAGIDTGNIIHQIRARYTFGDTPSQVGNRLICDVAKVYRQVINNFDKLEKMPQLPEPKNPFVCKMRDFSEESVIQIYDNFKNGIVEKYLAEEKARCKKSPIITNPAIGEFAG